MFCSPGFDTPQDFVKQSIRPCRTSGCYKMYTTLPLFCRVWYPSRLSSVGSDTRRILFCEVWYPVGFCFAGVSDPTGKLRPRGTRRKSFESLPFSLKGHFSKIVCIYKLHYPRHVGSMLKEPSNKYLKCFLFLRGLIPCRTKFKFENLWEFEAEF